jgi:hypothetical protein
MPRVRLAVAAALLVATAGTTTAHARPPAGLPRLAGSVTVTARTTAAVRVATDVPLRFDAGFENKARRVAGRGRHVGALLVSLTSADWVGVARYGFCDRPRCQATLPRGGAYEGEMSSVVWADIGYTTWAFDRETVEVVVPPGTYDLVVLTDGEPVTVTIPFRGARGSTRLVATEPRRSYVGTTPAKTLGAGFTQGEVHAGVDVAGGTRHARVGSALFWEMAEGDPVAVSGHDGWACTYPGGVASSAGDPYGPGCPGVPVRAGVPDGPCTSYYPTGWLDTWTPYAVVDGYWFAMGGCNLRVGPEERLAIGVGQIAPSTDAGIVIWWVED